MNSVQLIGRLTKDPNVSYTASQMCVARFTLAVNRQVKDKNGETAADFISIVCFGKTAELVEKFMGKGRMVGVTGRIQTGSYEKDGRTVYTTDVVADRVEFLDRAGDSKSSDSFGSNSGAGAGVPDGFSKLTDDDIPF